MHHLAIKNLAFSYRKDGFGLAGLDMEIKDGSCVGIIGPNGSGKSTLLRLLLKILPSPANMIFYNGSDMNQLSQQRLARLLAYLPQTSTGSYSFLAEEIIAMGRYPHGQGLFYRPTKKDSQIIENIIERLDLGGLRKRPVDTLSGGEYQRVLLARCFVQQTPFLLLDEPTNHLDLRHQLALIQMIKDEQKKRELNVIAVFHDLNLALGFADKLLLLDNGRVAAWDTPPAILESRALERVYRLKFSSTKNPFTGAPYLIAGILQA
ncbi:MAG: ABC transporter ATP-binding protein [Spirochaetaceae bacterium]|nr:MAG: ABC transporter ATP-binding protein [Spirochaetaceae bacterium]